MIHSIPPLLLKHNIIVSHLQIYEGKTIIMDLTIYGKQMNMKLPISDEMLDILTAAIDKMVNFRIVSID